MNLKFFIIVIILLTGNIHFGQNLPIVYSNNLNGYMEPCQCPASFLGGMTRVITAINQLRITYPDLLLVDSGDFFKSYSLPAANWLMLEMMHAVHYDAIAVGEQEFVEGSDFLIRGIQRFPLPIASVNLKIHSKEKVCSFSPVILEKAGHKIGVIALIDPDCFEDTFYSDVEFVPVEQVLSECLPSMRSQVELVVVVYHAGFERAVILAKNYPAIDVIIAGHSQEMAYQQIGRQMIVQNGYDGEYLGILRVDFNEDGLKYTHEYLPINESFEEDHYFKAKIRQAFSESGKNP